MLNAPDAILTIKTIAENTGASFCVVTHRTLPEREGSDKDYASLLSFLRKNAIQFTEADIQLNGYRYNIHINAAGQVNLADAILDCLDPD